MALVTVLFRLCFLKIRLAWRASTTCRRRVNRCARPRVS